jgi:hypothetical protein
MMSISRLMSTDDIFIVSPAGERIGPVKASVQAGKVFIADKSLVIEEGGTILRPLPNGRSESYRILEVQFHQNPTGRLSHYTVIVQKDTSLVPTPTSSGTTINITNSQGIQIGDGNILNIVAGLETLIKAIDSAEVPDDQKSDAKKRLKAFLSHPLTVAALGTAAGALIDKL